MRTQAPKIGLPSIDTEKLDSIGKYMYTYLGCVAPARHAILVTFFAVDDKIINLS
jgi:hypothetical protein